MDIIYMIIYYLWQFTSPAIGFIAGAYLVAMFLKLIAGFLSSGDNDY